MSADSTVYLITGANRGIGLALAGIFVKRPNTIVIATSRKPVPDVFASLNSASGSGSKIFPLLLDEADPAISSATLAACLQARFGITRLDVVIANAGGSAGFKSALDTSPEDLLYDFTVNAVGPAKLFQATWPLLSASKKNNNKKFVLITSSVGSIAGLDQPPVLPGAAYGMSKAAANYFAKKLSVELKEEGLLVGIIHPGWVKTGNGQAFADAVGFPEPPMTLQESSEGVVHQIDTLTPEKSGQFLTHNGEAVPW
ncbi:hypothetical protein B0H63DRAFT_102560 [Podospora didyma]|uniref:Uncharacterized protein n=1 Tax=Podospora didyma TaxID=330526 RepID=A0AAE0NXN8_9PEZI|nr:hypothetical protein B0H63DRAFT_102560 [Podospora didyma]